MDSSLRIKYISLTLACEQKQSCGCLGPFKRGKNIRPSSQRFWFKIDWSRRKRCEFPGQFHSRAHTPHLWRDCFSLARIFHVEKHFKLGTLNRFLVLVLDSLLETTRTALWMAAKKHLSVFQAICKMQIVIQKHSCSAHDWTTRIIRQSFSKKMFLK